MNGSLRPTGPSSIPRPSPDIVDGKSLAVEETYGLLREIHRSSEVFAVNFSDEFPSPAAFQAHLQDLRRRPGALFLAACCGSGPAGFLLVEPRRAGKLRHTADLHMGVRPEARGRGIGSALLGTALRRLREQTAVEIVYLMVRADNKPALRLYRRHGFETLAVLPRDIKTGEKYHDGILMRRAVASA